MYARIRALGGAVLAVVCLAVTSPAQAPDGSAPRGAGRAERPGPATARAQPDLSASPTSRPILLDVGDPAPPLTAASWLNGRQVEVGRPGQPPLVVLVFWATWSGPSRAVLPELTKLHERYRARGVVLVGVVDETEAAVRAFLEQHQPPPFVLALDERGATARAYCAAAGIGFVPYAFVVGPDRAVAWHGHPQQPELSAVLEELLAGRYDRAKARERIRRARSVDQLEELFREAYANEAWHTALLALDGLLEQDAPRGRVLRYKLSLLLGEVGDVPRARQVADELLRRHADDAALLNSAAWDVVSQPRLYLRGPEIGLRLARAADRAAGGASAACADTYARALHLIGRVDLAIRVQERAVKLAGAEERERFEEVLAFYRACQALQGEAPLEPR